MMSNSNTIDEESFNANTSRNWDDVRIELRNLEKYVANWDGEGADAVAADSIRRAMVISRELETAKFPTPDMVYPSADGTIFVEWRYSDGFVEMLNICPNRNHVVSMDSQGKIVNSSRLPTQFSADLSSNQPREYNLIHGSTRLKTFVNLAALLVL
jgi:hypothetical protein